MGSGLRVEEFYREGKIVGQRKPLKRKAEEIEALLQATEPPTWASDSDHKVCFHCNTAFTLVNRRHHCRHCGVVFCGACTSKKVVVERMGFTEPIRVCDECHLIISTTIEIPMPRWAEEAASSAAAAAPPQ